MKKKDLAYGRDAGFRVPEGYFQEFEARLLQKMDSSSAGDLPVRENPFQVPDNYFAEFDDHLLRTLDESSRTPRVIPLQSRKRWYYLSAVAAVIIVLLTTTFIKVNEQYGFDDLDMIAIENYLYETQDYEHPEETFAIEDSDFSWTDPTEMQLSDEALLEYLQENIDEPSVLLNED